MNLLSKVDKFKFATILAFILLAFYGVWATLKIIHEREQITIMQGHAESQNVPPYIQNNVDKKTTDELCRIGINLLEE